MIGDPLRSEKLLSLLFCPVVVARIKTSKLLFALQAFFRRVERLKVEVGQIRFSVDQYLQRYLQKSQAVFERQLAHV